MILRSCFAAGIGLALVHPHPADAAQHKFRHQSAHQHSFHRQSSFHRRLLRTSAELKVLTALKKEIRDLRKQMSATQTVRPDGAKVETLQREVVELKDEVVGLKERLWGVYPLSLSLSFPPPRPQSSAVAEPKGVTLKLPDVGDAYNPPQGPINPATAALPAVIEDRLPDALRPRSALEEAKTYLISTATPGYTMRRQGVPVAIERLHPAFVVKLAEGIKQAREAGLEHASVYSAYRPPAFRIGGFRDKFRSLHSYGLAVDVTGIGRARSKSARLWQSIVRTVGLYLPYGANNRAEFNHTQLVPTKVASNDMRQTITAREPKDLRQMWLASRVNAYVTDLTLADASQSATGAADGDKAAVQVQHAAAEVRAPADHHSDRGGARKAVRSGHSGSRGSQPRSHSAAGRRAASKPQRAKTRRAKGRRKTS